MGTVQKLNRLEEITREEQEEGAERLRRMGRTNIGDTIEDVMTNIPIDSDYYTKEQIDELLNDYVRKVEGKGLSTEDYTSSEKAAVNTISNKANKVTNAVSGNFAGLDSSGNLTDSGKKAADFEIEGTATGTSITLTDSADGYVQGITVKGHSEVVSGEIKSIGDAGWGVVDLGTLTWQEADGAPSSTYYVQSLQNGLASPDTDKIYLTQYVQYSGTLGNMSDKSIRVMGGQSGVYIRDTRYTDATAFKSAMSGVLLYYPLADAILGTPTLGITSKDGAGQGTAATITTGLPLRSVSDTIFDTVDNEKVTKKCAEVDLGNLTWIYNTTTAGKPPMFIASIVNSVSGSIGICSKYLFTTYNNLANNGVCIVVDSIRICDDTYTDAATFKTAMSGVKLIYPLATPTETPLTSAEKSALASLRTYSTTQIDATDAPSMTVDYLLNTDNGNAVAKIDSRIPQMIDEAVTLAYFRWNGNSAPYTQTVIVPGVLASDKPIIDVSISNNVATGISEAEQWSKITKAVTSNGYITFSCYEDRPSIDLVVNVKVVR